MARRPGGKAASRKARQRKIQRPATPRVAPPIGVPPVGTPDAREAVSHDPPRRVSAPSPERAHAGGSTLTDRERAEYHYVERDLRNIGILTAIMLAMLAGSWFLFNALGLVG